MNKIFAAGLVSIIGASTYAENEFSTYDYEKLAVETGYDSEEEASYEESSYQDINEVIIRTSNHCGDF